MTINVNIGGKLVEMPKDRAREMILRYDKLVDEMARIFPTASEDACKREAQRRAEAWALSGRR